MVFSSMLFLWIFLPLVLAAYYISPGKIRNGILVFFSLLFYAWGEPLYVFLMLFSVAVNFTGGILIEKYQTRKKKILVATLIINLGLLGYFKYFGTLTEAITGLFSADGTGTTLFQVALPIGISFYTFQALSYVIDVYRGEVPAQHNFWHMLLYISFFPQLIAGPIVKYRDIAAQITGRKETIRKFAAGIMRFCWGLGKKVLLANSFARVVDEIFKYGPYAVSRKALWLGAILYMMQIYYDFSGYSDMAIGLGKMFGFEFQENFNYPYTAGFPVFLVSRLCLYSFGRKSQRRGMHLSKPAYRIFPYRNVAWGWNSVYPLGALSWPFSYTGTCVAWKKTGKTAWNFGLGLHGDRGVFWMDSVPCRKYFPVFYLCEKYVCGTWRNHSSFCIS